MSTTEEIVRSFEGWAGPVLASMADHTERVARALTTPPARDARGAYDVKLAQYQRLDREGKAKVYPSLEAVAADKHRRSVLSIDLSDLIRDAERNLARWLATARRNADARRAEVPVAADDAGRVVSLAGLAPEQLLRDAGALLRSGDAVAADVRLRAALMGGRLRSAAPTSSYGTLRRDVDRALDKAVPKRAAIVAEETDATREYERAVARLREYRATADALLTADPEAPSEAVARARQLAGSVVAAA